jgi:hypothetical protein
MSAICMWAVFDMHDLHSFTFELLSVTKSYSRNPKAGRRETKCRLLTIDIRTGAPGPHFLK